MRWGRTVQLGHAEEPATQPVARFGPARQARQLLHQHGLSRVRVLSVWVGVSGVCQRVSVSVCPCQLPSQAGKGRGGEEGGYNCLTLGRMPW
jgi:hypothetical protein